ncbi:alpha-N-arabinofuranosidase [Pullulanibacillus pueri]|uniref:non-reducing end alpha-L-arabinofuranosidase n=1 Tax=Pullulanibacillus pueri TaxID=1437324 RepID=A0A8J2ZYE1_9BACL|nr:alpha-L-arabinofuranosidase C-terminal domain-containing protein [Pullulanibacillus pueri]MBM7683007.1 alpha-N-arabinofuranosidase [Pullulanibacillus pueri]GGH85889.1 hypothetical protein GCM10007096_32320 [Pullulanibacillus pueri]
MSKTATIQIKGDHISQDKINPYIFGHFVEDIRDHMDAMLAYGLQGMDFEAEDHERRGISAPWYPMTNGRNTRYALEPAAPRHTGHSQKIRIYNDDQCYAGIAQAVSIKGNVNYELKVFARASLEIKFVTIEIVDRKNQEKLCTTQIEVTSHDWREYHGILTADRDCSDAEFRILISSEGETWPDAEATGMLWLDHVSILPDDRVGIVKKSVVDMTRALNPGIMRLGGNYISAYHWEYGVGPMYERPVMLNEAWDTLACKTFGTDEFIHFCRQTGVEPQICVNDGSGTPEEAARWVEYCNGDAQSEMGAKRAANGHEQPYKVKYWEIGNEVWGPWQVGHCSAEVFAKRCVQFAQAMKAVDPEIVLLACGHTDPEWNRVVLEIAGDVIDILTVHIYQGYNHYGLIHQSASRDDRYHAIVSYPEMTRHFLDQVKESMKGHPHVKLAVTEYNTMYYPNNLRKGLPNEHSLEAAVANAGNLNEFLRNSHVLEIANFSDLVNGWLGGCIRVGDYYADQFRGKQPGWSGHGDVVYGTPTYHVMKMYANRDITYLVNNEVECDTFNVMGRKKELIFEKLPELDVVSCLNENKDLLTVFVVNRSLEDVKVDIHPDCFECKGKVNVGKITGPSVDSVNDVFQPENITESFEVVEIVENKIEYQLKAHSVYAFEIAKR